MSYQLLPTSSRQITTTPLPHNLYPDTADSSDSSEEEEEYYNEEYPGEDVESSSSHPLLRVRPRPRSNPRSFKHSDTEHYPLPLPPPNSDPRFTVPTPHPLVRVALLVFTAFLMWAAVRLRKGVWVAGVNSGGGGGGGGVVDEGEIGRVDGDVDVVGWGEWVMVWLGIWD